MLQLQIAVSPQSFVRLQPFVGGWELQAELVVRREDAHNLDY